jgi:hypothetical protein
MGGYSSSAVSSKDLDVLQQFGLLSTLSVPA